jgi:hypothetical protein
LLNTRAFARTARARGVFECHAAVMAYWPSRLNRNL